MTNTDNTQPTPNNGKEQAEPQIITHLKDSPPVRQWTLRRLDTSLGTIA